MKRLLRVVGILFLVILGLLIVVLLQHVDPLQKDPELSLHVFPKKLNPDSLSLDSLWQVVGTNKTVPEGFQKAALVAYSAYPQLKDVNIEMILTQSGAPMESNFKLSSLLGPGKKRVYRVLLNDADNTDFDPILLKALPFDSQVGILAHELGHVVYYHQLSTLQLAKWGILYLIDTDFRAEHEKSTDLMPVYHGLGYQIYDYAWYVRNDPSTQPLYEKWAPFIDKFYLTDKEILTEIENHPLYR